MWSLFAVYKCVFFSLEIEFYFDWLWHSSRLQIDSRFTFLRSYFTVYDPAYKKLIQLSSAALFLSNIAEQSRYTLAVISRLEAPFVFYLLRMRDRRGGRGGEPANLPTLHSFVALVFCRNNCPADCMSLREREKSQYIYLAATRNFCCDITYRHAYTCIWMKAKRVRENEPAIRYENANCKNCTWYVDRIRSGI